MTNSEYDWVMCNGFDKTNDDCQRCSCNRRHIPTRINDYTMCTVTHKCYFTENEVKCVGVK